MVASRQTRKQQLLDRVHAWPGGTLWVFAIKQAWAAVFGGVMVLAIIVTSMVDLPWLGQYDWLFVIAVLTQIVLLVTKLEKPHEVVTILLFHMVGLCMELFKTSGAIGSWSYPGEAIFRVEGVPLFSGFMYAAVGSYMARSWRVLELSFTNYPRRIYTVLLALAVYINFFSHHYVYDIRYLLFAGMIVLFGKTTVRYVLNQRRHRMPLLLGFGLITFFIWLAENIGTYTKTWLYPSQVAHWYMVSIQKFGSWLLLMVISFILIDLLHLVYGRRGREEESH